MKHPAHDPRSFTITITVSEWRNTYRPMPSPEGDELWLEIPEGTDPAQVWTEVWRGGETRSIRSGELDDSSVDGWEAAGCYFITEVPVAAGATITVEADPWTEADCAAIRATVRDWERERGIGVSGRVAADDFKRWLEKNRSGLYPLVDLGDAEGLLSSNLPELDVWSLYTDYLGSEGIDGEPVEGVERGCGVEGLEFNEFSELWITRREWMWRFLPRLHPVDGYDHQFEWLVDDPDDDAFVREQNPECVWTRGVFSGTDITFNGYLGMWSPQLADWFYITEVPCPSDVNLQVREDAPMPDEDEEVRGSNSVKILRTPGGAPRVLGNPLSIDLHRDDCGEVLKSLPDGSVDVVITSPEYLGIVDYGGGTWEGGRKGCDHRLPKDKSGRFRTYKGDTCPLCDAKRLSYPLGMEPTLAGYLTNLCGIFDQVYRVLKDTGSLWVNIGDIYAQEDGAFGIAGLKAGSLAKVPDRFATEMTDNHGWVLRNQVIWQKPSIRCSNVRNRLLVDYEPFYFFTKKATGYYFDPPEEPGVGADWRPGRTVWVEHLGSNPCGREGAFPMGVVERIILMCCPPGGIAMDPFMGSGTTGIVAAQYGRNFIGVELDRGMFKATMNRFIDEDFSPRAIVPPVQKNLVMSRSSALPKSTTASAKPKKPARTPASTTAPASTGTPTPSATKTTASQGMMSAEKAPLQGQHRFDPNSDLGGFILSRMKGHRNYQVEQTPEGLRVLRVNDGSVLSRSQVREVRHGMRRRERQRRQELVPAA